jgi:peptidoglycan-associated lipoprotein
MKKIMGMVVLLIGISIVTLIAGGCANTGMGKKNSRTVADVTLENSDQVRVEEQAKLEKARQAKLAEQARQAKLAEEAKLAEQANLDEQAKYDEQAKLSAASKSNFEIVYFDFDRSDLLPDAREAITKNAETILKSFRTSKIQIEGHCDERGSAEYNLALGEDRAKSVQKYLITLGVKAENLSLLSYGKEKPAVNESSEAAWAMNRRAEFAIIE